MKPMSLPPLRTESPEPEIPVLREREKERRGGAAAILLPGAPGTAYVAGPVPAGAPFSFIRTLAASLRRAGLLSPAAGAAAAMTAVAALCGVYASMVVEEDWGEDPGAKVVVASARVPGGLSSYPPARPADPRALVVAEELPRSAAPVPAAQPALPEPSASAAPDVSEALAAADEPLRDAPRMSRPRPRTERLHWNGAAFAPLAPSGEGFRPMRESRAAKAGRRSASKAAKRRATALRHSARRPAAASGVLRGRSQRAMGQLKLARVLSSSARLGGYESAKQGAGDAFEQGKTLGGAGLAEDAVPSTGLGASAPDVTAASAPALPAGENKTPYQDKVDDARSKNKMTKVMLILGAVLAAAGLALIMMASMMELEPATAEMMRNIGYALLGAGAAMVLAGMLMARQAKQDGKEIGEKYGQKDQQAVVEDCADQSLAKTDCAPRAVEQPKTGVQEAVNAESGAGYSLE